MMALGSRLMAVGALCVGLLPPFVFGDVLVTVNNVGNWTAYGVGAVWENDDIPTGRGNSFCSGIGNLGSGQSGQCVASGWGGTEGVYVWAAYWTNELQVGVTSPFRVGPLQLVGGMMSLTFNISPGGTMPVWHTKLCVTNPDLGGFGRNYGLFKNGELKTWFYVGPGETQCKEFVLDSGELTNGYCWREIGDWLERNADGSFSLGAPSGIGDCLEAGWLQGGTPSAPTLNGGRGPVGTWSLTNSPTIEWGTNTDLRFGFDAVYDEQQRMRQALSEGLGGVRADLGRVNTNLSGVAGTLQGMAGTLSSLLSESSATRAGVNVLTGSVGRVESGVTNIAGILERFRGQNFTNLTAATNLLGGIAGRLDALTNPPAGGLQWSNYLNAGALGGSEGLTAAQGELGQLGDFVSAGQSAASGSWDGVGSGSPQPWRFEFPIGQFAMVVDVGGTFGGVFGLVRLISQVVIGFLLFSTVARDVWELVKGVTQTRGVTVPNLDSKVVGTGGNLAGLTVASLAVAGFLLVWAGVLALVFGVIDFGGMFSAVAAGKQVAGALAGLGGQVVGMLDALFPVDFALASAGFWVVWKLTFLHAGSVGLMAVRLMWG